VNTTPRHEGWAGDERTVRHRPVKARLGTDGVQANVIPSTRDGQAQVGESMGTH
jgi:hypothetical protein